MNAGRQLMLVCAAASVGVLAWSGPAWAISIALAVPVLWAHAGSRIAAGAVVLAYQLAATRGLPAGVVRYYARGYSLGLGLWMAAGLLVAVTWATCWQTRARSRFIGACVAQWIVALPPIGLAGWVHPLTAAGALFPGTRWMGLCATSLFLCALAVLSWRPATGLAGSAVVLAALTSAEPSAPTSWVGVDTALSASATASDYERHLALLRQISQREERVVVLPETVGGWWTETTAALWQTRFPPAQVQAVLVGSEFLEHDGSVANALVLVTRESSRVVYRQRMPVPVTMWRPWSERSTQAYGWRNAVVPLLGHRAAVFICYEQLLVWPVLHSLTNRPDILIGCANVWWCSDTTIPLIQRNTLIAWSRLFDLPLVTASNFSPASSGALPPIADSSCN